MLFTAATSKIRLDIPEDDVAEPELTILIPGLNDRLSIAAARDDWDEHWRDFRGQCPPGASPVLTSISRPG